jgi:hypothetical protein
MGLELNHGVIVKIQSWIKGRLSNTLLQCEVIGESHLQVHNETSEFVEEFALQGFGKEITNHFFGGTVFNRQFVLVDAVSDEVESTIEMFSSLAARLAAILFE